jgi:3-deoxy-7-phosphoheptulonate synthase
MDAIRAAGHPHCFFGVTEQGLAGIVETRGNRDCHVILRGGRAAPNYAEDAVAAALTLLRGVDLPERVMIDLSHDNSGKDPDRQPDVAAAVAAQLTAGSRAVAGVMLESFLVGGRQDLVDGRAPTYGQSITDGCLGFERTVEVLDGLAAAVRARRAAG